ncbi:endonuclease [Aquimarina rhabdastrellae]
MKTQLLIVSLFISVLGFSQIPANYYDSADGLTGYALKTELKNIISNGHVDQGYGALYTAYQTTDSDNYYENDGSVLDMYTEKPNAADSFNFDHDTDGGSGTGDACGSSGTTNAVEGGCYNREHLFPQGFFNERFPMRSDVHHVVPSDAYVNNQRGNFPFGEVTSPTNTYSNGSKLGPSATAGYNGTVFEPIDEFKGDIARALLYFATRYEDNVTDATWDNHDSTQENPLDGSNDQVYETWYIALLVSWHIADPVSQRETDRNNAAYNFQGNANPFISHPEYVQRIWNVTADTEAPSVPTGLTVTGTTATTANLSWTAATDNVGVTEYDIYVDGTLNTSVSTTTASVSGLSPETTYTFTVAAKDAAGNTSAQSTAANGTTTANTSSGNELFISEYVEGSSNNKAIEIANFTGNSVDLSIYSLKRQVNGSGNWSDALILSGSLNTDDVYVIANSQASDAIKNIADLETGHTAVSFNGNDPIGLFKNDVLIDIVGVFNGGSADFAENVTLIRKSSVNTPNTSFSYDPSGTSGEWDTNANDDISDLGTHTLDPLSTNDFDISKFNMYPNPSLDGSINIILGTSSKATVAIYNILGKLVYQKNNVSEHLQVSNLPSGILLLQVTSPERKITKKLIVR